MSRARLSTLLFNDGKALARISTGKDVTTRTFESAMAWFSANWPTGLNWPEGIERPVVVAPDHLPDAGKMVPAPDGVAA